MSSSVPKHVRRWAGEGERSVSSVFRHPSIFLQGSGQEGLVGKGLGNGGGGGG